LEITNVESGGGPLPVFLYVPKEEADAMRMSLMVEASSKYDLDSRGFTELPIIRETSGRPCACSVSTARCRTGR
jgi:hypothetical protein